MELPGGERAVLAHAAGHVDDARRPEVGPGKLLLAGPDQLDRPARRLRQPGGLDRRLAGVLAAVAGAGVGHDHAHRVLRQAERLRQLAAHAERPLRAGPDRQLAVLPFGHRRARLERGVGDVGDRVASASTCGRPRRGPLRSSRCCARAAKASAASATFSGSLPQIVEQSLRSRWLRRGLPLALIAASARSAAARRARRRRRNRRRGPTTTPAIASAACRSTEASVASDALADAAPCHSTCPGRGCRRHIGAGR